MEELNCSDDAVIEDVNKALDLGFYKADTIMDTVTKVSKVREGLVHYPYP